MRVTATRRITASPTLSYLAAEKTLRWMEDSDAPRISLKVLHKGEKLDVSVGAEATGAELQGALKGILGGEFYFKVLHKGKQIADGALLKDAGVKEGSKIMAIATSAEVAEQEGQKKTDPLVLPAPLTRRNLPDRAIQPPAPTIRIRMDALACRSRGSTRR